MRRAPLRLVAPLFAAALAACAAVPGEEPPAEAAPTPSLADNLPVPGSAPGTGAAPGAVGPPVPHVYLAVQPARPGHPASVVFAIDAARDGTPSDDPAIRLTPDAGRCNPQEMQHYAFPAETRPVVSEAEQARGLTPRDLPAYLAASVTGRMIEAELAAEPEDTRALNICTRKLWERLVLAGTEAERAAGQ